MELEGVVQNGVIVPDDAIALPEGTRVSIIVAPVEEPKPFGERFAQFKGGGARAAHGPGRAARPLSPGDAEAMTLFADCRGRCPPRAPLGVR